MEVAGVIILMIFAGLFALMALLPLRAEDGDSTSR